MGELADGDGLRADGAVVGEPTGVGELLVGVGEGLGVRDGLGDRVGPGEVRVALDVGAAEEEELVAPWSALAGLVTGSGRTRK